MKRFLIAVALFASACTHTREVTPEPLVVVKEVGIPVVAPCVPKELGDAPEYADSDEALKSAPNGAVRFQLLILGRAQRVARLFELEPVVRSCPRAE